MPQGVAHVRPGKGRLLWVLGELVRRKTTSDQTGGAYSLFEVTSQPGTGPPPHVHHREEEAFWVLEGEYEFLIEGRTLTAITGSLIYFSKGTLHAHRVVGESVGRMLLTQTRGRRLVNGWECMVAGWRGVPGGRHPLHAHRCITDQ